ncbi:DUF4442 domain-containing protein [Plantactinospora sp. KBS50]|nr:DUF4442 domain-containing protein [Plantactinospora sp. KBS50]ASW53347.1 DUF4442 domain-containing protein [Plantactinospora sp. KBS50]
MTDGEQVAAGLRAAVPFVRTLGLEFLEIGPDPAEDAAGALRAVVRLPDAEAIHNHVAGPHAGAIFTLGETASGAVVMAAVGHLLDRAVPLTVRAEIAYRKLSLGPVTATAWLHRPVAEIEAELAVGGRPRLETPVRIATADGVVRAEMTLVWALRLN